MNERLRSEVRLSKTHIFNAKHKTKIGTWNVRTLYQDGRLEQLLREMKKYNLDILGISEMRWTGQGKITSEDTTILYAGKEDHHSSGVGILLNKEAAQALEGWKPVNDRIIMARLQSRHAKRHNRQQIEMTHGQCIALSENLQGLHHAMQAYLLRTKMASDY